MEDNTRPFKVRVVTYCMQQEAIETLPWPAMSHDMNPNPARMIRY
jgi:hypothetical protein